MILGRHGECVDSGAKHMSRFLSGSRFKGEDVVTALRHLLTPCCCIWWSFCDWDTCFERPLAGEVGE